MLTQHANLKVYNDVIGTGKTIAITPLFLQNHNDPWAPNELYDLAEAAHLKHGFWQELSEPIELGKIIINDHKEWRYEGDANLDEEELEQIAGFVLNAE